MAQAHCGAVWCRSCAAQTRARAEIAEADAMCAGRVHRVLAQVDSQCLRRRSWKKSAWVLGPSASSPAGGPDFFLVGVRACLRACLCLPAVWCACALFALSRADAPTISTRIDWGRMRLRRGTSQRQREKERRSERTQIRSAVIDALLRRLKVGIVGLPNVGKSTLYNTLVCAPSQPPAAS